MPVNSCAEVTGHGASATAQLTQLMSSCCCSCLAESGVRQGSGPFWTIFRINRTYSRFAEISVNAASDLHESGYVGGSCRRRH
jgi:hypothetical protein